MTERLAVPVPSVEVAPFEVRGLWMSPGVEPLAAYCTVEDAGTVILESATNERGSWTLCEEVRPGTFIVRKRWLRQAERPAAGSAGDARETE